MSPGELGSSSGNISSILPSAHSHPLTVFAVARRTRRDTKNRSIASEVRTKKTPTHFFSRSTDNKSSSNRLREVLSWHLNYCR